MNYGKGIPEFKKLFWKFKFGNMFWKRGSEVFLSEPRLLFMSIFVILYVNWVQVQI